MCAELKTPFLSINSSMALCGDSANEVTIQWTIDCTSQDIEYVVALSPGIVHRTSSTHMTLNISVSTEYNVTVTAMCGKNQTSNPLSLYFEGYIHQLQSNYIVLRKFVFYAKVLSIHHQHSVHYV